MSQSIWNIFNVLGIKLFILIIFVYKQDQSVKVLKIYPISLPLKSSGTFIGSNQTTAAQWELIFISVKTAEHAELIDNQQVKISLTLTKT